MLQEDQVVCENELHEDFDEVHKITFVLLLDIIIQFTQESFFQDIDILQNHGIVSSYFMMARVT